MTPEKISVDFSSENQLFVPLDIDLPSLLEDDQI
jgi:hypothetical protein